MCVPSWADDPPEPDQKRKIPRWTQTKEDRTMSEVMTNSDSGPERLFHKFISSIHQRLFSRDKITTDAHRQNFYFSCAASRPPETPAPGDTHFTDYFTGSDGVSAVLCVFAGVTEAQASPRCLNRSVRAAAECWPPVSPCLSRCPSRNSRRSC